MSEIFSRFPAKTTTLLIADHNLSVRYVLSELYLVRCDPSQRGVRSKC
jgi:hypothetical protein